MVNMCIEHGPVLGLGAIFRYLGAESWLLVDYLFIELFRIAS
jgi:hypothetical protein